MGMLKRDGMVSLTSIRAQEDGVDPLLPFEGAGPLAYKQSFGSRAPAGQAGLKPDEGHGGAVTRSSVSGLPPTSPWVN